jgi:hypothetical protein
MFRSSIPPLDSAKNNIADNRRRMNITSNSNPEAFNVHNALESIIIAVEKLQADVELIKHQLASPR